jgi:hypothetical protein
MKHKSQVRLTSIKWQDITTPTSHIWHPVKVHEWSGNPACDMSCSIEIFTVGNKNLIEKCCRAEAQFKQSDSRIWPWSCHQLQAERSTRCYGFCQHDLPRKTCSRQVLQNLPMLISNCPLGGLSPLIIFQTSMESRLWRPRASCFCTVSRGCIRNI